MTLADIYVYGYTHAAEEGGFELAPYPAVRAWLDRRRRTAETHPHRRMTCG